MREAYYGDTVPFQVKITNYSGSLSSVNLVFTMRYAFQTGTTPLLTLNKTPTGRISLDVPTATATWEIRVSDWAAITAPTSPVTLIWALTLVVDSDHSYTLATDGLVVAPSVNSGLVPFPNFFTTLETARQFLNYKDNSSDPLITRWIAAASADMLREMNRPAIFEVRNEVRNGNGSNRLTSNYWPQLNVANLTISGNAVGLSPDGVATGYTFDDTTIFLINNPLIPRPPGTFTNFQKGFQNVRYQLTYGFQVIPSDLEEACLELMALIKFGRDKVGLRSESLSGIGTVSYITDTYPKRTKDTLENYKIRFKAA